MVDATRRARSCCLFAERPAVYISIFGRFSRYRLKVGADFVRHLPPGPLSPHGKQPAWQRKTETSQSGFRPRSWYGTGHLTSRTLDPPPHATRVLDAPSICPSGRTTTVDGGATMPSRRARHSKSPQVNSHGAPKHHRAGPSAKASAAVGPPAAIGYAASTPSTPSDPARCGAQGAHGAHRRTYRCGAARSATSRHREQIHRVPLVRRLPVQLGEELRIVDEEAHPFRLLHQFKRLAVRWERRRELPDAFVPLACGRMCWRRLKKAVP